MPTNVLVFESDAAFAAELVHEFQRLDCSVQVVDDGNVGLQMAISDRPDLILLSIELPRMNGFSVCNKLKKDPALKDIPLIIMSSASTDDTFEAHRRLRTRADDYIHKPVAFADLLRHMRQYVPIGSPGTMPEAMEDAIVIDDEIQFEEPEVEGDEAHIARPDARFLDVPAAGKIEPSGTPSPSMPSLDVDRFTDDAFDHLLDDGGALQLEEERMPSEPPAPPSEPPPSISPRSALGRVAVPAAVLAIDAAELDRLRSTADQLRREVWRLESELMAARGDAQLLTDEVSQAKQATQEVQRLQKLVDDLKKPSSSGRSGGISSREFLDLREALNTKDKEILALHERMSAKDKELLNTRDVNLALERDKADKEDRLLTLEEESIDLRRASEQAASDKAELEADLAAGTTASAGLRRNLDATTSELALARETYDAERSARNTQDEKRSAAHAAALDAVAKQAHQARVELERTLAAVHEQAIHELRIELEKARTQAVQAEEQAGAERLRWLESELSNAQAGAIAAIEADRDERLGDSAATHATALAALEIAKDAQLAELEQAHRQHLAHLEASHAGRLDELQADRDRRLDQAQNAHAELEGKVASLEGELGATRDHLAHIESEKAEGFAQRDGRTNELEGRRAVLEGELNALREQLAQTESEKAEGFAQRDGRTYELEGELDATRAHLADSEHQKLAGFAQRDEFAAELEGRIATLESEVASTKERLADAQQSGTEGFAQRDGRIAQLESGLHTRTRERDALAGEKTSLEAAIVRVRDRSAELEAELGAMAEKLMGVEASMAHETRRAQQAIGKWTQDKASLEKAKDTLAAVLLYLEEVEGRRAE